MRNDSWTKLRARLLGTTAGAIIAIPMIVGSNQALAQDQDQDAAEDEAVVEEIIVTGSRIRRSSFDTVEPSIIIDRALIEKRAVTNIADLLNETPAFGAPAASPNAGQNGFSVGQNIVDFLGLGSQRTLTLVNGRRFVSSNAPTVFGESGGLQVDFNVIPVALVQRIETIATGGAPTYGSDAIAGTINVILRDDFEGMEVQFRYGTADDGDLDSYQMQVVMGGNFADDRGNIAISIEYNREQGLDRLDRPFFTTNDPFIGEVSDVADIDGDGIVDDVFQVFFDQRVQLLTFGGLISPGAVVLPAQGVGTFNGTFWQFADNGELVDFAPGGIPPGSAFFTIGGDAPDFFDRVAQIRSPLERLVISGFSHFDVNEYVTAFMEFTFANTEATELANQGAFNTFAFGDTSGALNISFDNPMLTPQAVTTLASFGLGTGDSFWVNRFNNDIVNNGIDKTENFLWRVVGGLNGDFEMADRKFYWEVSANFGQSDIETQGTDIIDARFINAIDAIRLTDADIAAVQAFNFVDADGDGINDFTAQDAVDALFSRGGTDSANVGDIVCRSVLDVELGNTTPVSGLGITAGGFPFIDGCVPLDIFGENRASQAAIDFVTGLQLSSTDIEQRVFTATLGGEVMELPGGTLSFAVEYQNRREEALFQPSGFDSLGLGRSSALARTGGAFSTDEFYGELLIPVIGPAMNIPFIRSIELNPKLRRVDNSRAGTDDTYTLGGVAKLEQNITVRGNFTQSIRSPSLVELFSPVVSTFAFGDDPCDDRFIDEGPDPATRQANCAAIGLGGGFTSNVVNATAQGKTGGNPDLQNETAKSWTVGVIFQPTFIPGLTLSADYISITMSDRITSLTLEQKMQACFDSTSFPDTICNDFTRDSGGQIIDFSTGQANAALSELQAVVFDLRYRFDLAGAVGLVSKKLGAKDLGSVTFRINGIRRIQNAFSVIGESATDNTGEFGENRKSITFDTTWERGPILAFYRIVYTDSSILDATGDNFFQDENGNNVTRSGDRFIHNMSVSYQINETVLARFGVNNLWNRKGTLFQRAVGAFTSGDERIGRTLSFTLKAGF